MSKRVISNFDRAIGRINKIAAAHKLSQSEIKKAISVMNSYLGITSHYDTYNLKKSMISKIDERFMRDITLTRKFEKINKRK